MSNYNEYMKNSIFYMNEMRFFDYILKNLDRISKLEYAVQKVIDSIAWWIPIRKWRDNFRDKFWL